jgi:hypothetical protein
MMCGTCGGLPTKEWKTPSCGNACEESRVLITTDRGFTEYRRTEHSGILIMRLRQPTRLKIHQAVMLALERFRETEWPGQLVVVRDRTLSVSKSGGPIEKPWN